VLQQRLVISGPPGFLVRGWQLLGLSPWGWDQDWDWSISGTGVSAAPATPLPR
jgi:hypothetical protein